MKTDKLTAKEIARLPSVPRITPLQAATLAAKARTGRRYMVSVSKGRHLVSLASYALNAKGDTTGGADVQELASFPTSDVPAVVAYLDTL
jgi:hypothetical protein